MGKGKWVALQETQHKPQAPVQPSTPEGEIAKLKEVLRTLIEEIHKTVGGPQAFDKTRALLERL
jgi:hypothetical protein